jgi:hypothetical protein
MAVEQCAADEKIRGVLMSVPGPTGNNATYTATTSTLKLPLHNENDVVVVYHDTAYGASTCDDVDFTQIAGSLVWWYQAGAVRKTQVTWTESVTNIQRHSIAMVISNCPAGAIDGSAVATTLANEWTNPSLTLATGRCLVLSICATKSSYTNINPPENFVALYGSGVSSLPVVAAAYTYQEASGSLDQHTWYNSDFNSDLATVVVIAIKDTTPSSMPGYCNGKPFDYVHYMNQSGASGKLQATSTISYDPTSTDEAIGSVTDLNSGETINTTNGLALSATYPVGSFHPVASLLSTTGAYRNLLGLKGFKMAADLDLANRTFAMTCKYAYITGDMYKLGELAFVLGFGDGTSYRLYNLSGSDAKTDLRRGIFPTVIQPSQNTHCAEGGTLNLSSPNNKNILIGARTQIDYNYFTFFKLVALLPLPIAGGSAINKCSFADAERIAASLGLFTVQRQHGQATGQFFTLQSIKIGDGGTTPVGWDSTNQGLEFPPKYDYQTQTTQAQIATGSLFVEWDVGASTPIVISNEVFNMGDEHQFRLTSGIYSGRANVVLTGTPVLNTANNGITFVGCNEVQYTTLGDMSGENGNTWVGCPSPQQITISSKEDFEKLRKNSFIDCENLAIKIVGDHAGQNWLATGLKISGGKGSADIEYTGTTDFTIEFDVGSGFSQGRVNNSSTGTLTVSVPTVSLTVTSNIAASDIKIFETGTQTIEASATGTSASTSVAGTYDWTIQKAGYLPQRGTGVVLGTSSVPVSVTLIKDPVYSASHGLSYTTDFTYNRTTKKLTCVTRQAGRDFYSAMIDAFIAQSSLDNTPFPLTAVGIDSIFFNDDAELLNATSEDNWFDAGIRYINSSGTTTAEWCSIKSSGPIPVGVTGRYQTGPGTGTTALRTTGAVNQIIQIYGDATHGNFDRRSYLVIKFQANPYIDTRSDILSLAGVSTLEPFEYSVAIEPTSLDITAGDSGAVLTLVDHTAAPITVGEKLFSYEIQDGGTNSAEAILRAWDYNIAQSGTYQGTDTFNLPEFIAQSGSTYETRRGIVETKGSTLYGCYVSRGGSDHPDFSRFQSNDGTYYTPAVQVSILMPNIPDGARVRIYNEDSSAEIDNSLVTGGGGYSFALLYTADINISYKVNWHSGTNAKLPLTGIGVITSAGFTLLDSMEDDTKHNALGFDGEAIDLDASPATGEIKADFANIQIDANDPDGVFDSRKGIAWWRYICSTATGIATYNPKALQYNPDVRNIEVDGQLQIENIHPTLPLKVTEGLWIRKDGASIIASTSNTVWWVPNDRVYQGPETGVSGLTAAESAKLDTIGTVNTNTSAIKAKTDQLTFTAPNVVDASASVSEASIRAAIGLASANLDTQLATITEDTNELQTNQGNWITATGFATVNPDNASIAVIKGKTDQLTFTLANQVDANAQSINDNAVTGDGSEADPWRKTGVTP